MFDNKPVAKAGKRVYAIRDAEVGKVFLYGFGVYEGEEIPDKEAQGLAAALREANNTNPKIRLDNGKIVWGCECWWGAEDQFKLKFGESKIVEVDITAERMKQTGEIN